MALRRIIHRLWRGVRRGVSKLTYYDEYVSLKKRLEERSDLEEVGSITAALVHDIANPLAVIDSELFKLRGRASVDDKIMRSLELIQEMLTRISVSTSMVQIFRGRSEYFERFMQKVEVLDFVHGTLKMVKRELSLKGLGPGDVYFKVEGRSPLFISAYGPMLLQAVVNILKNSVEAIREARRETGVVKITVKAYEAGPDREVWIEIADNGCGIPSEDLQRIMTLFSSKTDRKPNSGLGLFVARRVVELHRGRLAVQSEVGKGTKVSLILPSWRDQNKISGGEEFD